MEKNQGDLLKQKVVPVATNRRKSVRKKNRERKGERERGNRNPNHKRFVGPYETQCTCVCVCCNRVSHQRKREVQGREVMISSQSVERVGLKSGERQRVGRTRVLAVRPDWIDPARLEGTDTMRRRNRGKTRQKRE